MTRWQRLSAVRIWRVGKGLLDCGATDTAGGEEAVAAIIDSALDTTRKLRQWTRTTDLCTNT